MPTTNGQTTYDDGSWGDPLYSPQQQEADSPTKVFNDLRDGIEKDPRYGLWLSAHGGGRRSLSPQEQQQLSDAVSGWGYRLLPATKFGPNGRLTIESNDGATWAKIVAISAIPLAEYAAINAAAAGAASTTGATATTVGGVESGATSGLSPFVASGALGTTGGAATTVGANSVFDAAGNFIGPSGYTWGANNAGNVVSSAGGITATDLLKYGLPTAGNIVSGLIQANASGKASDAQTKYLEEALAYQKEQDAYNRENAAAKYAYGTNLEASRYGDYSANIAPYVASGTSANERMAQLLGLTPNALTPASRPAAPTPPPQTNFPPPTNASTSTAGAPMVTLQGPDGSKQSFQSNSPLVAQYLARPGYSQVQANG